MRLLAAITPAVLAGCATAPETHGRWYIGVASVVALALICLGGEWVARRVERHTVDETDEGGA